MDSEFKAIRLIEKIRKGVNTDQKKKKKKKISKGLTLRTPKFIEKRVATNQ